MLQWVHGPQTVVMRRAASPAGGVVLASMGPRSSDRGYVQDLQPLRTKLASFNGSTVLRPWLCFIVLSPATVFSRLQWVHGPQTVVMEENRMVSSSPTGSFNGSTVLRPWLCLVKKLEKQGDKASMGPRSSDRGYGHSRGSVATIFVRLQWVHGPQTVVMQG